jgi:hypothetical protein
MNRVHVYSNYKNRAVALRKRGKTYSEILAEIPVAKSTLSLWLREVHLAKKQKQLLTAKKLAACFRGGLARKMDRIERTKIILEAAKKEISKISNRELWLIGIALYWAEGTKEKSRKPGVGVRFMNSDYRMIRFFLLWLKRCIGVAESEINFELHLHENNRYRLEAVKNFWAKISKMPVEKFQIVRYKTHKPKTKRYNIGDLYYGCLQVRVNASSTLNRKIAGWIEGIIRNV